MNGMNALLVILGIIFFILGTVSGGLLFYLPYFVGLLLWVAGIVFVYVGLSRNQKEKKTK